jgi:hypothetical protein
MIRHSMLAMMIGATPVVAQQSVTDGAARFYAYRVTPALDAQFVQGYERHLQWHANAHDTFVWYLWELTNGDRSGWYVDATMGHQWADFDHPVDPSGDRANWDLNVQPYVITSPWNAAWQRVSGVGDADANIEQVVEHAPTVLVYEYQVRPDAVARFVAAAEKGRAPQPFVLFQLVSGGEGPLFRLMMPLPTWATLHELPGGDPLAAAAADIMSMRTEIWRFRPDLSRCRWAATKCFLTMGQ